MIDFKEKRFDYKSICKEDEEMLELRSADILKDLENEKTNFFYEIHKKMKQFLFHFSLMLVLLVLVLCLTDEYYETPQAFRHDVLNVVKTS